MSKDPRRPVIALAMTVMIVLCSAATAKAQAVGARNKPAAEALFEEGRKLLAAKKYADACRKFEASLAFDPGIGTLLYLGDCYEQTGRTASAWASFREAASLADAERQTRRGRLAQARASALEPRLVKLNLDVAPENSRLEGFELRQNGILVPPASLGVAVPLDPGEYRLVASAPGYASHEITVNLTHGSVREAIPPLRPLEPEAPPPKADPPVPGPQIPAVSSPRPAEVEANREGSGTRVVGLVVAGAGLVSLAAGGVFGLMALDRNADSERECRPDDPTLCTREGVELREDAQQSATWSTLGFVAGGVLLGSGVVLMLFGSDTPSAETRTLALAAAASPRSVGVTIGGGF